MEPKTFVGLDVHKKTVVATAVDRLGNLIDQSEFGPSDDELIAFLRNLPGVSVEAELLDPTGGEDGAEPVGESEVKPGPLAVPEGEAEVTCIGSEMERCVVGDEERRADVGDLGAGSLAEATSVTGIEGEGVSMAVRAWDPLTRSSRARLWENYVSEPWAVRPFSRASRTPRLTMSRKSVRRARTEGERG
jgi:hypothetical protein